MELTRRDFEALDKAEEEFFKNGNVTERCPRCGNNIVVHMNNNSYEVKCNTENCIKVTYRGI